MFKIYEDGIVTPLWCHILLNLSVFYILNLIFNFILRFFSLNNISLEYMLLNSFVLGVMFGHSNWIKDIKLNGKEK